MLNAVRLWWPLLLGVLSIQLGNGLQTTAVGLRIDAVGFSAGQIALVMGGFYAGQVLASLFAPRVIAGIGHVPAYVAFTLVVALSPLLFLLASDPITWTVTRFAIGLGLAGIFVTVESWLNDRSPNEMRGRVFAVYIWIQLLGLMAAQFLLPAVAGNLTLAFLLVVVFGGLAIAPVVLGGTPRPQRHPFAKASFRVLIAASPVGVAGAVVSGFVWAVVMAMSPIYAQRTGFDASGIALFVAAAVCGGLALQGPIGWLSDMRDRRAVLCAASGLAALAALAGALAGQSHGIAMAAVMAVGGLTFPFYAVAISHVNDRLDAAQRVPASGAMILLFGVGSILGPAAASAAMAAAGPRGFFFVLAAVTAAFGGFAAYRLSIARPSAAQ